MGFFYCFQGGTINISGQTVPGLGYPHCRKVFPDVQSNPPLFLFVPTASGPAPGHHGKGPRSIFCPLFL